MLPLCPRGSRVEVGTTARDEPPVACAILACSAAQFLAAIMPQRLYHFRPSSWTRELEQRACLSPLFSPCSGEPAVSSSAALLCLLIRGSFTATLLLCPLESGDGGGVSPCHGMVFSWRLYPSLPSFWTRGLEQRACVARMAGTSLPSFPLLRRAWRPPSLLLFCALSSAYASPLILLPHGQGDVDVGRIGTQWRNLEQLNSR
ncbi:hypothetical protein NDU88_006276 [Pleurodeles waltl]|uniref:Uncharacterized protein n=1 Tax=Pleurodeles waltl TaxID=8319 RepID=A0AAV7RP30_PLEWA|nr:hypothetical protein NDU88_006276 [Pleurodeles waltl]